ncbi:MAG TPA: methylenetetrahydrofolate reductase [NAD(P)H] [Aeromicrobium sp.]|nr:methylenetetrahydrofolate reductase [NAD(P)H] [Aeromicrobium sp.]
MATLDHSLSAELETGGPSFSFEFFPPKDDAGEQQLWATISELEPLNPTFVSVTYGAGGSTRERTVRITGRIAESTTLLPVGHLTVVEQSRADLEHVLKQYEAAGVRHVLALRGDPQGGLGQPWRPHPEGLDHAVELVEMARDAGGFCVGVAAFPEGHPEAEDLDTDARVLASKAEAGAEFAVTQLFFRVEDYFALVERARFHGCDIPVLPGIMPITSLGQVTRMAQMCGSELPAEVLARLEPVADDPVAVRNVGIEIATELCDDLLSGGAPGLHFYTLNRSKATREIYANLRATP